MLWKPLQKRRESFFPGLWDIRIQLNNQNLNNMHLHANELFALEFLMIRQKTLYPQKIRKNDWRKVKFCRIYLMRLNGWEKLIAIRWHDYREWKLKCLNFFNREVLPRTQESHRKRAEKLTYWMGSSKWDSEALAECAIRIMVHYVQDAKLVELISVCLNGKSNVWTTGKEADLSQPWHWNRNKYLIDDQG